MHHLVSLVLVISAGPLLAQQAGWRDMPLVNRTSTGSAALQSRVCYPAYNGGPSVPVMPRAGGWPVIVFLHGNGSIGRDYPQISGPLVQAGYIFVGLETGTSNATVEREDGTALFQTLVAENADKTSPLYGALDMQHCALQGYSMGAGNTIRILAANPGYCAGFVHAPTSGVSTGAGVRVPFCSVHGQGDTTSPATNSATLFTNAVNFTGTKTVYLFNTDVDHNNIISDGLMRPNDAAVWARVRSIFLGFFDCYLHENRAGLEQVVGSAARSEPRLVSISHGLRAPVLWLDGTGSLNTKLRVSYDGEPGPACTLMSPRPGALATAFGTLLLDSSGLVVVDTPTIGAAKLAVLDLQIPPVPSLLGGRVYVQAAAQTTTQLAAMTLQLSNAADLTIVP